jgi:hypothetical protein
LASESGVAGGDDRLGPFGQLELAEDVGHVVGHGLGRQEHLLGDLAVGQPGGDPVEDLALTIGQLREWCRGRLEAGGEPGAQPLGQRGPEHGLTGCGRPDRGDDVGPVRALEQVSGRTGRHRREDHVVVFEHGQDEHRGARLPGHDLPGGIDPVPPGQLKIHDHDVGLQLGRPFDGGVAVVGLADHRDVAGGVQHRVQSLPDQRVVIDQQDRDGVVIGHGVSSVDCVSVMGAFSAAERVTAAGSGR